MPLRPPLSSGDRRALLALARRAILDAVVHQRVPDFDSPAGALSACAGVFVTLHRNGRLRGCIGHAQSDLSLAETTAQCAIGAALQDPRFPPVGKDEAADLEISVSVLSELEPISPAQFEAGKHGLLVVQGERRGLLLPQVAAERRWTAERFLEAACEKAGLAAQAWRDPRTQLFGFTAEEFSELNFVSVIPVRRNRRRRLPAGPW